MIFVTENHPTNESLRVMMVAKAEEPLEVSHFYLDRRNKAGSGWKRSRKLPGDKFEKYMQRFGFDILELRFLLEEAFENHEGEE